MVLVFGAFVSSAKGLLIYPISFIYCINKIQAKPQQYLSTIVMRVILLLFLRFIIRLILHIIRD